MLQYANNNTLYNNSLFLGHNFKYSEKLEFNIFVLRQECSHDSGVVLGEIVDICNVGDTRLSMHFGNQVGDIFGTLSNKLLNRKFAGSEPKIGRKRTRK